MLLLMRNLQLRCKSCRGYHPNPNFPKAQWFATRPLQDKVSVFRIGALRDASTCYEI